MKQRTTIQIEHDTLVSLRNEKVYFRETYDDVIKRLLLLNKKVKEHDT